MSDSFETYLPWFLLREIPFAGSKLTKKLIQTFRNPETVFKTGEEELKKIDRISAGTIRAILDPKPYLDNAGRELELVLKNGLKVTTLTDPEYPPLLKKIPDPPLFLTYLGHLAPLSPAIAVVGSRNATTYGLSTSEHLSGRLAQKGFQIVSGLARGIDTMAHKGALKVGQKTVAVMGCGLNKIYPRENKSLFHEIAEKGTLISEFKYNVDPFAGNFPQRNRIIAGMSCGAIIVEAAQRSGSLITARLAGEYNREVFAVPGSIQSKKSQGTHALLKQGAKLVENEVDIIEELGQFVHQNSTVMPSMSPPPDKTDARQIHGRENPILSSLEPYPVHIDDIIRSARKPASQIIAQLLDLELEGRVIHHHGDYYSIAEEEH